MKKTTVALSLAISLITASCGNSNNTSTNMPDSGYEPRTDTTNSAPVTSDSLPRGAVGVDTISMGQTNPAGVPDSANHKKDSARKR